MWRRKPVVAGWARGCSGKSNARGCSEVWSFRGGIFVDGRAVLRGERQIYPVHPISRKSLGEIIRKLSVTESQSSAHLLGTSSRRKTRVASANSPRVW